MWHPARIDGRTLVVLRTRDSVFGGHDIVESGQLEYDGKELELVSENRRPVVTQRELELLLPVVAGNQIAVCQPYDFFVLYPHPEEC